MPKIFTANVRPKFVQNNSFLGRKNDPKKTQQNKRDFKPIHIIYLIGLLSNGSKCTKLIRLLI